MRTAGIRLGRRRCAAFAGAYGFYRHRLDHQRAFCHQEGKAPAIAGFELAAHRGNGFVRRTRHGQGAGQCGVGAFIAKLHAVHRGNGGICHALLAQFSFRLVGKGIGRLACRRQALRIEPAFERQLAHRQLVRQPHTESREHARQRMQVDAAHAQRVGHQAGVLAARAAEALQRVLRDVVAARH
jgi:hypothetical protein